MDSEAETMKTAGTSAGGATSAAARAVVGSAGLSQAVRASSKLSELYAGSDTARLFADVSALDAKWFNGASEVARMAGTIDTSQFTTASKIAGTASIAKIVGTIDTSQFTTASKIADTASIAKIVGTIHTSQFTTASKIADTASIAKIVGTIDTSQFTTASKIADTASIASTLTGVLDTSQFSAASGIARLIAGVNGALDSSRLTGASEVARIVGALDAARFTQANIDFGGYDLFTATGAAAQVSGVLDGVKLTTATAAAADMLRFISPATDVVSPVLEAARAAGRLHFGRLIHDLQLPDPAQLDPPNWPVALDIDIVTGILNEDGIPLVWVPRREIVKLLVEAPDRPSRIEILLGQVDELVEDCRRVLADINHPSLVEQLPLATQALDAFAAGHRAPAHALATAVTDTLIKRAVQGGYKAVSKKVFFNPDAVPWHRLRLMAGLAPIGPFFTSWFPNSGTPAPEALSRHVSLHQAAASHYSPGNAVVAMLLATSILRCIQELQGGTYTEAA